jgi:transposase
VENIRIRRLDHHGIVSGVFAELGFEEAINELIGVDEQEVVTAGQAVKAMVMCGLGFTYRPMMLTPQFFSNLAVEGLSDFLCK